MGTNKSVVVSFSIAILLLLSLLLLLTYNSRCNSAQGSGMKLNGYNNIQGYSNNSSEPFYYEKFSNAQGGRTSPADISNSQYDISLASAGIGNYQPSESSGNDVYNQPLQSQQSQGSQGQSGQQSSAMSQGSTGDYASFQGQGQGGNDTLGDQGMQSCYPRDRLTADDLLPKDAADSKWARVNPSGGGNVGDQNYLSAGYHIGVNTVGQSLRNANLQLRSEIPNPQNAVGPWSISTIEPDLRQQTLEIGSSPAY
jgi:hypothetical protein